MNSIRNNTHSYLKYLIALLFCIAAAIGITSHNLNAQVSPVLQNSLQRTLDSMRIKHNLIGVSAAIVLRDKSEWLGVSGMSDPSSGKPLTSDMLFGAASITKTFIAAAIMQLASENKLSLDDPLYKWLPAHQNIDSLITIKQLLAHTSGIYNYTNNWQLWNESFNNMQKKWTREEILSLIGQSSFQRGTRWEYSNTNYMLLGMIIEKVTENHLNAELQNRIFNPVGLNNTFLNADDSMNYRMAGCWTDDFNSHGRLENLLANSRQAIFTMASSAGGIITTPRNLAKWARCLFGGEFLPQSYLNQMLNFSSMSNYVFGLGAMRSTAADKILWGHGGNLPGYNSYMAYSDAEKISIAVMINQDTHTEYNILEALLRTIINFQTTDVVSSTAPEAFSLEQNYPNPFNPVTTISYRIPSSNKVELKIFDVLGNEIRTLVNQLQDAGNHEIEFDANNLSSGIYLYRLRSGDYCKVNKMILSK